MNNILHLLILTQLLVLVAKSLFPSFTLFSLSQVEVIFTPETSEEPTLKVLWLYHSLRQRFALNALPLDPRSKAILI